MPCNIEITPEAKQEIERELEYSHKKWGGRHTSTYRQGITDALRRIGANPLQYALKPHYGEGVRTVLYKGNYIVYRYEESLNMIHVIGFPNIHKSAPHY